jgi:hypothetical protein
VKIWGILDPYVSTTPITESPEAKAIRLLNRQLGQLQTIRGLNNKHAEFKAWRDSTMSILERSLGPTSQHTVRFRDTRFFGPSYILPYRSRVPPPDYTSPEDAAAFKRGCETAEASLKAAIDEIAEFGLYTGEAKPTTTGRGRGRSAGGVSQHFSANTMHVTQAVATDSAVQRIGHLGNKTGADLKEISNLLQQSQDLSPNQVRQGVADVEGLAVEVEKPEEKRNWKAVLEYGQRLLELAGRAVDLGTKLAPYTPVVAELVEKAKHAL